jgi:antitoxin component YwqK of YwqJK toxin-antitoxin module
MYKLKLLHTNGAVRYQGWTKKKPRNDRQIDECGLLLPYFEGLVYEYGQDRNFIQCFCIKSGKRQPKQIVENENFEFHHGFPSKSFYYTGQKDPLGNNCGFGIQYNYDEHDNIKIHFIGRFENGKRCGSGKLFEEDGTMIFEGNWKNDKPHGFGKKFHPNGKLFLEAEWWKGNPSSNCSIYSPYGALRFQGKWKDYQGPGITYCNWTGHCLYQGYFKNGMGNGEGIATDNTYYSHFTHGNFCNGKAEGEVEMYVSYQDITSISFRGNMKNGEKDGFGISMEHGEIEYWGFFKNDLHHGFGIEFKMGYLPSWTPQAKFNTPDMFDKRFIEFQGVYHEDDKIEGKTFYNNGNIRYDGTFETREYNLEHYNDFGIIGPYFFSSHNEHYHGFGKLYYPSGALCYDGEWYYNLQLGKGTFYSEDGKQKIENEFIDGAWYGHGIYYLSCKTGEEIFYSGSLKNGLPHGEGIIFEYDLSECHRDEPPKINSVYSGAFFEGNYYHKVKHTNGFLYNFFHTIVFSGDYQDGTFVNGIQFEHECLHRYIKEPKTEQIIWKNGKIFDQNKERYEARQRHYISSYLETKERYWIKHVPRWICLSMHKEILGCEKKNNPKCSKLSILDEIILG